MITRTRTILDFDIERGTIPIPLSEIRRLFNFYPRLHPFRIWVGLTFVGAMRVSEALDLTWDNFTEDGICIYRPSKTDKLSKKHYPARRFRLSPRFYQELMEYRQAHFFGDRRLFPFNVEALRGRFKTRVRPILSGLWAIPSGTMRRGAVPEYRRLTLRGIRTTMMTLVYHYYSKEYGHGDLALSKTQTWAGHSCSFMTANYYIKNVHELELDELHPQPLLALVDRTLYEHSTRHITDYVKKKQHLILEW